ncbi:NAD(P)H-binding protein [Pediococcus parvulus]|uniref:NAD(P)H-binding protein n=1 Tax=Pediococcus parvulus TaxID=54062 RepID=UPI003D0103D8
MKKVLILAAGGQIARIVEERILKEQKNVELTLFLRHKERLQNLEKNSRVKLVDGDLNDQSTVSDAMKNQDIVIIAVVDHSSDSKITRNVIKAAKANNVSRIIQTNIGGIYDEIGGEFADWNKQMVGDGIRTSRLSADVLEKSGLDYTILRLPWLNDRDIHYVITHKGERFIGVSGSRASVADVIVKIIADPSFGSRDSISIGDPDTDGKTRPVY